MPALNADELSEICKYLKLKLTVYGPQSDGTINFQHADKTTKGFEGWRASVGHLVVAHLGKHVEPLSEDLDKVNQHNELTRICEAILPASKEFYTDIPEIKEILSKEIRTHFYPSTQQTKLNQDFSAQLKQGNLENALSFLDKGADIFMFDKPLSNQSTGFRLLYNLYTQNKIKEMAYLGYYDFRCRNYIYKKYVENKDDAGMQWFNYYLSEYHKNVRDENRSGARRKAVTRSTTKTIMRIGEIQHALAIRLTILPLHRIGKESEFHKAIRNSNGDLSEGALKRLIDKYGLDAKNEFGVTPMHLLVGYAKKKNIDSLFHQYGYKDQSSFLNYGLKIKQALFLNTDCKDINGMTPLHYACIHGDVDMLLNLYDMGADILAKDSNGNLPIHYAAKSRSYDCADALIQLDNSSKLTRYSNSSFNVENKFGQTPALIARQNEDNQMLLILLGGGIVGNIQKERAYALAVMAIQQDYIVALEALIIKFTEICKMRGEEGCGLLYHAVMALNYRMCHMVLHPLSKKERIESCQDRYQSLEGTSQQELTLIDLIQEKINLAKAERQPKTKVKKALSKIKNAVLPNLSSQEESEYQLQQFRKIKRLLTQYSSEAYQKLPKSKKAKLAYKWTQDVQEELESTQPYKIVNMAMTYGKPFMAGVEILIKTGQPWYAFEAAVGHYLGEDVISIAEKLTGICANQSNAVGITASFAHNVFGWINCYRHTTSRTAVWAIKKSAAVVLSKSYGSQFPSSYLTYLDCSSVIYGLTEGFATHQVGPYLSEYWQGIESTLVSKYNIPTVENMALKVATQINETVQDNISIDLAKEAKNIYYWLRYEVGGLPYPVSIHPSLLGPPRTKRTHIVLHDGIFIFPPTESIINAAIHESVSKANPTVFIAESLAEYSLNIYKQLMPNQSEAAYLAMYQSFLGKYTIAQHSKNVGSHDKSLKAAFNSIMNDAKLEAATNIVQHSYNTTNDLNSFVPVYTDGIMRVLNIPPEYQAGVMLGFEALAGRYHGEPNKLLDETNSLINALISPNQSQSETLVALHNVAIVLEENGLRNYGNYIAYNLVVLGISAGTIEKSEFDAKYFYYSEEINRTRSNTNSKKYNASSHLASLSNSVLNKPATSTFINAGVQASNIVSAAKSQNGGKIRQGSIEVYATQALQVAKPEYFEESSEEKVHALHQFLRTKVTSKLTHRIELILTYTDVVPLINAFNNGEPLTGDARVILSQFKPMDILAAYAVFELTQQLDASPYYNNLSVLEQLDLMEKLSSYTHLSSIEDEVFKMVTAKNLTGAEYHNFENGMAPAQFCQELPQSAKQFSTNMWVGTSDHYERDHKEGNESKHLSGKIKKYASAVTEKTGGIQVGVGTDGVYSVGTQKGFMIPINEPKQPAPSLFEKSPATYQSSNQSMQNFDIDELTQSIPEVYRHPFGFVPVPEAAKLLHFSEFMQLYDEMYPTQPALQPMNYIAYCPKPNSGIPRTSTGELDLSSMTPYMPDYSTYKVPYKEFYNTDYLEYLSMGKEEGAIKVPNWDEQQDAFWGNTILGVFIKEAEAMPLAIPLVAGASTGLGLIWARLSQNQFDEPDSLLGEQSLQFPAIPNLPMILAGGYLAAKQKDNVYPFPIEERLDGNYITPIPEEGSYKDNIYDFPLTPPAATLLFRKGSTTDTDYNAANVNAQNALNKKLSLLEKAQAQSVKTQVLPDGKIRYYGPVRKSSKSGPTSGSSFVTEFDPSSGKIRSWNECYDQSGNVNRIHPKSLNGQDLTAQHYPPTGSELSALKKGSK